MTRNQLKKTPKLGVSVKNVGEDLKREQKNHTK